MEDGTLDLSNFFAEILWNQFIPVFLQLNSENTSGSSWFLNLVHKKSHQNPTKKNQNPNGSSKKSSINNPAILKQPLHLLIN